MKRLLPIIISLFSIGVLSAQSWSYNAPDYNQIKMEINDTNSPYYYPQLLEKYHNSDTSISLEEMRCLYYGFVFQPTYCPYDFSGKSKCIDSIFEKKQLTADDYKIIIKLSDSLLTEDPFDVSLLNNKLHCYRQLLNTMDFDKTMMKMRVIFDAIMSSGNGVSRTTAFYVIAPSHEYAMLNYLGFSFGGQQRLIDHFDYLVIAANDATIEGLYFDVSPCLNYLKLKSNK